MPVSIRPSPHGANVIKDAFEEDALGLLKKVSPRTQWKCTELLQSSFHSHQIPTNVLASRNGFVNSIVHSYSQHRHLTFRPEDVWFAILTQFSSFVNANSEAVRHHFVAHEGRKHLQIEYPAGYTRQTIDFGDFAKKMTGLIDANVVDAELRDWIMPDFSTTTEHDRVVASILMMGTMQKFFSYGASVMCGLPSVTLLGEKDDYERIYARLDKLKTFGDEPSTFCDLLKPVIRRFVLSFDEPQSGEVLSFWQRVLDVKSGSGFTRYSGWIAAFCFWTDQGRCLYDRARLEMEKKDYEQSVFGDVVEDKGGYKCTRHVEQNLELDGVRYHRVDSKCVAAGWLQVPVSVSDGGGKFEAEMIAGSVGIECRSSGEALASGDVGLDSMQPVTGWWMFEKFPDA
ncbi:uncharacterized protein KY384_008871 [Bacidia gigantensis]|uniref:uncharacterized protein n=1 Tax=Bacidia gigantensis TaxID=2732470 RepID=UPI001D0405AD|nr:uncharacterized protein KY384_008871 [Bacidia gigantensis]KAG8525227.1 hypothetical protein KY384_008871 [Bacidia gigantensis]